MMAETIQIDVKKLLEIFSDEKSGGILKDFQLPIRWEGGDFYKALYFRLKEYRNRIEKQLPEKKLAEYRDDIRKVCYGVCLAVSETFRGNPYEAYNAVDDTLKLLTGKYECYLGEEELKNCPLYRAVDVKDKAVHDRKRVFHVPFNLRSKMSTTRYSIPGYPALYLGTSLALNCEEIHRSPKDDTVMAARFVFNGDTTIDYDDSENVVESVLSMQFKKKLTLLDLSVKPQDFQTGTKEDPSSRQKLLSEHILLKKPQLYLLWYPLITACSFIRIYREDPYSPEYIVPQLVTQWAKKKETPQEKAEHLQRDDSCFKGENLCGMCYFSCLSERASEKGLNFAFPSSGSDVWAFDDLKNFCPILTANFELTEPVFVSEYESSEMCEKALKNPKIKMERIGKFSRKTVRNREGKYIIPDGEGFIPSYAFTGENLEDITIPDSVTSIGDRAFFGCTGLTSITIPDSVTSIGDGAFSYCTGLTSITIPNSVTSIGDEAFDGCTGLTSINIPNSVTSIGNWAFDGCTNLNIRVPRRFENLDNGAFDGCKSVTYYDP